MVLHRSRHVQGSYLAADPPATTDPLGNKLSIRGSLLSSQEAEEGDSGPRGPPQLAAALSRALCYASRAQAGGRKEGLGGFGSGIQALQRRCYDSDL